MTGDPLDVVRGGLGGIAPHNIAEVDREGRVAFEVRGGSRGGTATADSVPCAVKCAADPLDVVVLPSGPRGADAVEHAPTPPKTKKRLDTLRNAIHIPPVRACTYHTHKHTSIHHAYS